MSSWSWIWMALKGHSRSPEVLDSSVGWLEQELYHLEMLLNGRRPIVLLSLKAAAISGSTSLFMQWCSLYHGYLWNKIISKLFHPSSTSVWNNFISGRGIMPKIIQSYFRLLLQLMNIFQHVQCRTFFTGWNNFISVSDMVTCEIKTEINYFKIILFHM